MCKIKDLSGQKFNRLTVLYPKGVKNGHMTFLCECECGNTIVTDGYKLKSGNTKSCGCLRREVTGARARKHGMKNTRLNSIWRSMNYRCNNPKTKDHAIYYDRGIKVCDEWKNDFLAFYKWAIENGYSDDLSIDRIDNDKGYYPDNCRWATAKEQRSNQRRNHDKTL